MELDEFVANSLIKIAKGITTAINRAESEGLHLRINPMFPDKPDEWSEYQRSVEFDVAVTASQKEASEGGGGIKVWVLEVNAGASQAAESGTINRLKFSIPVLFPAHATVAKK